MRETGVKWVSAYGRITIAFFVSVCIGAVLTGALSKAAEPPFIIDESTGDVRNIVTFSIRANHDQLATGSITVSDSKNVPIKTEVFTPASQDKQKMTLVWKTNELSDGSYSVRYQASNTIGEATGYTKNVTVTNAVPLITLEATPEGRVIGGMVSRNDVDIVLKVDGQKTEVVPRIAEQSGEDGSFIWSAELPADIAYGKEYAFEAVATVQTTNTSSAPAQTMTTLHTPVPAPPAAGAPVQPSSPPIAAPILDFAMEIGKFVAPVLPKAPETQLFGVSTTDLTDDMTEKSIAPVASQVRPEVLSSQKTSEIDPVPAPIKPSDSGWMILGVAWYWIFIIAAVVSVAVFSLARVFYIHEPEGTFVRAEST